MKETLNNIQTSRVHFFKIPTVSFFLWPKIKWISYFVIKYFTFLLLLLFMSWPYLKSAFVLLKLGTKFYQVFLLRLLFCSIPNKTERKKKNVDGQSMYVFPEDKSNVNSMLLRLGSLVESWHEKEWDKISRLRLKKQRWHLRRAKNQQNPVQFRYSMTISDSLRSNSKLLGIFEPFVTGFL